MPSAPHDPAPAPADPARFAPWTARPHSALLLLLVVLAARLVYLAWLCPYDLIEDEAHYWEWSRRLGLSYYSKGPGIAWTIWASCRVLGVSEFAVRAPAAIASFIAGIGVSRLARDMSDDPRAPFFGAACWCLTPLTMFASILGTIDSPYFACWALASWGAWRALHARDFGAWILLGAALGVGVLFKYTVLLLPPGIFLYAFLRRAHLAPHPRWRDGLALGAGLLGAGLSPVVIWNARNGWPTVRHLLGHVGAAGGDVAPGAPEAWWMHLASIPEFALVQLLMGGAPLVLAVLAVRPIGKRLARNGAVAFAFCCAAPILLFYGAVSAFTEVEGNWPGAAFVTLGALAGIGVVEGMDDYYARLFRWRALPAPRPKEGVLLRRPETRHQVVWHFAYGAGTTIAVLMLRLDVIHAIPGVGGFVPIGRLIGARDRAQDAAQRMEAIPQRDPFLVAQHYGAASQMAFYLPGRPTVYCASSRTGGRRTQYDLWPDTSLDDLALRGRSALCLGATGPQWREAFDTVTPVPPLRSEHKRGREVFIASGYHAWPAR